MSRRAVATGLVAVLLLGAGTWGVARVLERVLRRPSEAPPTVAASPGVATPHIVATLFYGAADGERLAAATRDVPLAEGLPAQGREILLAQLQPPEAPLLRVIPEGTTLRGFYTTDSGDAYVDLSGDLVRRHPGGTTYETLTVQSLVAAVTANLPAITRVQILVDGREVETLAGHVDLSRPLTRDPFWFRTPAPLSDPRDPGVE